MTDSTPPPPMPPGASGASPAPQAMRPGTYLRLRREAAGLTHRHIAIVLVPAGRADAAELRASMSRRLRLIESDDQAGSNPSPRDLDLVDQLGSVFAFSAAIYWLLVGIAADPESEIPVPQICRGCGCTWSDPCNERGRGCAWSAEDPSLCTTCADKAPANDLAEAGHAA